MLTWHRIDEEAALLLLSLKAGRHRHFSEKVMRLMYPCKDALYLAAWRARWSGKLCALYETGSYVCF